MAYTIYKRKGDKLIPYQQQFMEIDAINMLDSLFGEYKETHKSKGMFSILASFFSQFTFNRQDRTNELLPKYMKYLVSYDEKYDKLLSRIIDSLYKKEGRKYQLKQGACYES